MLSIGMLMDVCAEMRHATTVLGLHSVSDVKELLTYFSPSPPALVHEAANSV